MSELIRRLNLIKKQRTEKWLTPSQSTALTSLARELRVPGSVNLVGSSGVGKTFLAWYLVEKLGLAYFPNPDQLADWDDEGFGGILVDNCISSRTEHRAIIGLLNHKEIVRAIIVSRHVMPDYTRYVELDLTAEDIECVRRNLDGIGVSSMITDAQSNLWQLVNPFLQGV